MNEKEKKELQAIYDLFSTFLDGNDDLQEVQENLNIIVEIGNRFEKLIGE